MIYYLNVRCYTVGRLRESSNQGVGKLLFSQPAESNVDATVVYGVNQCVLEAQHEIVSAASCTTNCILPVIKVLEDSFGIEAGTITTIHSAMNDQPLLDTHNSLDLRKSRAATASIIPVDTALAPGIGRIIPRMADRFTAQALRVPTLNVRNGSNDTDQTKSEREISKSS